MALTPSTRLFERWRTLGDADALARLFDREAPGLLRLARHLLRDAAHAEDALQATFLVALERADAFHPGERVEPWLAGVLVREVHRLRRGAARRPDPARLERAAVPSPEAQLAARELDQRLDEALGRLPETYAVPLRRRLLEDRSPAQIAEELGLRPGTVHVRLSRGLVRLRRLLPAGLAGPALAGTGPGAATPPMLDAPGPRDLSAGLVDARTHLLRRARRSRAPEPSASLGSGLGLAGASGPLWAAALALAALLLGLVPLARGWVARASDPATDLAALEGPTSTSPPPDPAAGSAAAVGERSTPQNVSDAAQPATGPAPTRFTGFASDTDGQVLPGAEVWSLAPGTYERVEQLATCDGRGAFAFEAPAGTELELGVFRDGYAPWATPLDPLQRERAWRDSCRATPRPGDDGLSEVWLGQLFLTPGAWVSGRVLDANGDPEPDARLVVYPLRMQRVHQCDRPWGRSGPDGRFELDVRVAWEARALALIAVTDDGRTGWTVFACPEGRESVRDLELRLFPDVPLEVRVLDPDGRPVSGARVHAAPGAGELAEQGAALHREPNFRHAPLLARHWQAVSGADGVARFPRLPLAPSPGLAVEPPARVGSLCFVAEAEGFGDSERSRRLVFLPDPSGTLEQSDGTPWDLVLSALPVEVPEPQPRAAFAPLALQVVDPQGRPWPDGYVSAVAEPLDPTERPRALGTGPLDRDGRWSWDEADAGPWRVAVYGPDLHRQVLREPLFEVVLHGGGPEQRVVVPRPLPPPAAALTVHLRSATDGRPLDPTRWELFRIDESGVPRGVAGTEQRARAGGLRAEHLPPGRWQLRVEVPGHRQRVQELDLADGEDRELTLELEPRDD